MNFYIIPTPIGNLDDLTLRAKKILESLDFLIVENRKVSQKLLTSHNIHIKKIAVYNDNSTEKDRKKIISFYKSSKNGGIISDAGTPLISDPGYKLIRKLISKDINIISLPGANSITTSLVASGLPTNKFQFLGFAPRQKEAQEKLFTTIKKFKGTSIFFESPLRVAKILSRLEMFDEKHQLDVCLAKELTKVNETFIRGNVQQVQNEIKKNCSIQKGEFVILVSTHNCESEENNVEELYLNLKGYLPLKDLSVVISKISGVKKNLLYKKFLQLSKKSR